VFKSSYELDSAKGAITPEVVRKFMGVEGMSFIQIVALDDKNFIRTYREFNFATIDTLEDMDKYIRERLLEKQVSKIEIKKWRD